MPQSGLRPSLDEIQSAARIVYSQMHPTPQYRWPLLEERAGRTVWVKHENYAPTGAFKVRGGLVYMNAIRRMVPELEGVVTATRGNHGQSIALAARAVGVPVAVVVPHGNVPDKNRAMSAYGAEVLEAGDDFQDAVEEADRLAEQRGWHRVPSLHPLLVQGVATWALELLQAVPELDVLYVPVGLGSGLCGALAARDALGMRTEIVGVVSSGAPTYARSMSAGVPTPCPVSTTIADGMACRTANPDALAVFIAKDVRLIEVTDDEIAEAIGLLFSTTHNVAEGAGAAATAAMLRDDTSAAKVSGVVLTGQNIASASFSRVVTA
jgi:threonine dehydratase